MAERPGSGRDFGGRAGAVMTDDAVSAWFVREIVPLEATLMHYLQHNWRNASDIPDLRQEVYARVFEAARERIPDNPKNFLLVCARNLLINLVRREHVVAMESIADLEVLGLASDIPAPDRQVMDRQELRRLEAAIERLPPRTREAIRLAYFEGLSRTQVAKRMGVTQQTASEFIANGTIALADILYEAPASGSAET